MYTGILICLHGTDLPNACSVCGTRKYNLLRPIVMSQKDSIIHKRYIVTHSIKVCFLPVETHQSTSSTCPNTSTRYTGKPEHVQKRQFDLSEHIKHTLSIFSLIYSQLKYKQHITVQVNVLNHHSNI